ncbi:MAG: TlpA family protein disulfide reductase [Planctomycetaceae bacterium]|jgi:thiol-disulfide isomerase/thioredoxin|nr:TlpA family protein disulfide reductase [Planctomycetaceae bacterium]
MQYLSIRFRIPTWFVVIFCNVFLTILLISGQVPAQQLSAQQSEKIGQTTDIYVIPTDKTPKELLEYAQKTLQKNPISPDLLQEELLNKFIRQAKFIIEITDTALSRKPEEPLRSQIFLFKFQGLFGLAKAEDTPEIVQQLESYLDELEVLMPKSREAKKARLLNLQRQIDLFVRKNPTKEEFERISKIFLSLLRREPVDFPNGFALNFIEWSEIAETKLKQKGLTETSIKELTAILQSESLPVYQEMLKQVNSVIKHLGQEFTLQGILLDGKQFDIKTFHGKVVLVDFFTSWCAPCIEELPHLKEIYAQYHDQGFEIVGVGGDKPEALKKMIREYNISWTVVSETLTVAKRLPSIERQYGIKAYPTMFLIDREGKLVNSNARGQRLEAALKRQFLEELENLKQPKD